MCYIVQTANKQIKRGANEMTQPTYERPFTADCLSNEDEQGYLAECEHREHALDHCSIDGCAGFIVNWRTFNPSDNFICEICEDCGWSYDANGRLVEP